jgi:hypothetical protein
VLSPAPSGNQYRSTLLAPAPNWLGDMTLVARSCLMTGRAVEDRTRCAVWSASRCGLLVGLGLDAGQPVADELRPAVLAHDVEEALPPRRVLLDDDQGSDDPTVLGVRTSRSRREDDSLVGDEHFRRHQAMPAASAMASQKLNSYASSKRVDSRIWSAGTPRSSAASKHGTTVSSEA